MKILLTFCILYLVIGASANVTEIPVQWERFEGWVIHGPFAHSIEKRLEELEYNRTQVNIESERWDKVKSTIEKLFWEKRNHVFEELNKRFRNDTRSGTPSRNLTESNVLNELQNVVQDWNVIRDTLRNVWGKRDFEKFSSLAEVVQQYFLKRVRTIDIEIDKSKRQIRQQIRYLENEQKQLAFEIRSWPRMEPLMCRIFDDKGFDSFFELEKGVSQDFLERGYTLYGKSKAKEELENHYSKMESELDDWRLMRERIRKLFKRLKDQTIFKRVRNNTMFKNVSKNKNYIFYSDLQYCIKQDFFRRNFTLTNEMKAMQSLAEKRGTY